MAEGALLGARVSLHPVHPARLRNDRLGQVSWLPDRRPPPPSRSET